MKWISFWLLLTITAVAVFAARAADDPAVELWPHSFTNFDKEPLGAPGEPVYKGHALRVWLENVNLRSPLMPPPLKPEATEAIAQIGSNAAPWLVKFLRESTPIGFGEGSITQAFEILGPQARAAIPDLADLAVQQQDILPPAYGGWVVIPNAPMEALGAIGPEAFPAVFRILTNTTSLGLRLAAIRAIGCFGTNAIAALPELLKWVCDTNDFLVEASIKAVAEAGRNDPAALAAISNALDSPNELVRQTAFYVVQRFGCEANPTLIQLMDNGYAGAQWNAFHFLLGAAPALMTNPAVLALAARHLRTTDGDRLRQALGIEMIRAASEQAAGIRPDPYSYGPVGRPVWGLPDATNALCHLAAAIYSNNFPQNVR